MDFNKYIPVFLETNRSTSSNPTPNSRHWVRRREFGLVLGSVAWFLFSTYIVCLANAYLDRVNPSLYLAPADRIRLPDPLLEYFSPVYRRWNLPHNLADILVKLAPFLIFSRVVALMAVGEFSKGLLVLRRQLYTLGTCYLVRAPFVLMTVLPNPLLTCVSHADPRLFYDAFLLMAQLRSSCGDVLFSGHTIMFTIAGFTWSEYPIVNYPVFSKWMQIFSWTFCSVGVWVLIASTYHYTVDCVIGLLIVTLVWKLYHFVVQTNHFNDTWYSKLLLCVDGDRYLNESQSEAGYDMYMESTYYA